MYNDLDLFNFEIEFKIFLNSFKKLFDFKNNEIIRIENKRNKQIAKTCPMKFRSKNSKINLLPSKNFSSIECDM